MGRVDLYFLRQIYFLSAQLRNDVGGQFAAFDTFHVVIFREEQGGTIFHLSHFIGKDGVSPGRYS